MANTFLLEIVTPEKQVFTGQVESLILPAVDGSYGVQPGHEPVVTAVEPGTTRYKADGQWHELVVMQGFAEIMSDYAVVLVSAAERPEDIDAARAERAKERAEERLRQHESRQEYLRSKAALARAMARLSATRQEHR
ncbi:MAG: ATP synthase F1 subunit epsilon [Subdoligranulum variabile]|nr:MAG: ATP synthase F1 subunit epsilon [Subdoligranulum variabile]